LLTFGGLGQKVRRLAGRDPPVLALTVAITSAAESVKVSIVGKIKARLQKQPGFIVCANNFSSV